MKRAIRSAVVHMLYAVGALQLMARVSLRRKAVVLMYHRVLPPRARAETWSHPAIIVSSGTFERHMQLLRRYFRILTPEQFLASLDAGRFDSCSCLVTFDDGWIDTYTEAWPVLQRHHVPALVFLPSAYIGTGDVFWQERLGRVLYEIWHRARAQKAFAAEAREALAAYGLAAVLDFDEAAVRETILAVVRSRKAEGGLDPAAPARALLRLVPDAAATVAHIDRFISWEQAREMAQDGVTFGAHGETHRRLTTLPADQVRHEIEASRDALRQGLGTEAVAFCYPNGDYNQLVAATVASGRFRMAFSTDRGRVGAGANRFALRRVNVHEDMTGSAPMFLARLVGVV